MLFCEPLLLHNKIGEVVLYSEEANAERDLLCGRWTRASSKYDHHNQRCDRHPATG